MLTPVSYLGSRRQREWSATEPELLGDTMFRRYFTRGLFLAMLVSVLGACAGDPTAINPCWQDYETGQQVCVEAEQ